MLLANCLLVHHKGREWRRNQGRPSSPSSPPQPAGGSPRSEREVVSLFFDSSSPKHALSLHNIVKEGASFGIVPGHWVGPYVLCQTFNKIFAKAAALSMAVYLVAEAGGIPTLYRSRAYAQAQDQAASGGAWKPLLILIPVTLGVNPSINPCYVPQILTVLSMPQSVGIVGGKPGSSVYVIGRQAERILYLDPHTLKPCFPEGRVHQGQGGAHPAQAPGEEGMRRGLTQGRFAQFWGRRARWGKSKE